MAFGKNEFIRIWGDRALESNWRWSSESVKSDLEAVDEIAKTAEQELKQATPPISIHGSPPLFTPSEAGQQSRAPMATICTRK